VEEEEAEAAQRKKKLKRRFFLIRVSILLFILFVVVLYALRDLHSRRARKDWDKTLDVAVVLLHVNGTTAVDPEAIRLLKDRSDSLEQRLATEAQRHRGPSAMKPFRVKVFGPVETTEAPPTPASDSPVDLAKQAVDLERWLRDIDPKAGVVADHWDTRIYVTIRGPQSELQSFVEGQSQQDGRIGMVSVELDASMADLTLIVVAHELMHTLGASDKYDPASGRTRIPDGLAEPNRSPLYPQSFAEIMARNRPISVALEAIPLSIDEMAVGPLTAKEIGWIR
jgi:hypothetical protein